MLRRARETLASGQENSCVAARLWAAQDNAKHENAACPKARNGSFRQQHFSNASRLWLAHCFHPGPTPAHESVVLEATRERAS